MILLVIIIYNITRINTITYIMKHRDVYILDCRRTPIGKFMGAFQDMSAIDLSVQVLQYFINKYPFLSTETNEIFIGNAIQAGLGLNPARIVTIKSGFSQKCSAITINHACGSGLTAVIQGAKSIAMGDADIVIAGGMESMTNAPHLMQGFRKRPKSGNQPNLDSLYTDGLFCSITNNIMGVTGEKIAQKYHISRNDQDKYACDSHQKSVNAILQGYFKSEIIPIKLNNLAQSIVTDEQPRKDSNMDKLSKLSPVFEKHGTVTAGNSCPINDGAAFSILVSDVFLKKSDLKPLVKITGYDYIGTDPFYMGLGPVYSIQSLLKRKGMNISDIDIFEINEAFAAQVLSVIQLLRIDTRKTNLNGGAIALGHPIGASGTRILSTLISTLKRQKLDLGIASLCIGGGQGVSLMVKNV
jgi:acetyl-CoA C-acetyltransferase